METVRQPGAAYSAPNIAGLRTFNRYRDIEEILRSPHFLQGNHRTNRDFVGGAIIVLDGEDHFDRRRTESGLFSRDAMTAYETKAMLPSIERTFADELGSGDEIVHIDLVKLVVVLLHRIAASVIGIDGLDTRERVAEFCERASEAGLLGSLDHAKLDRDEAIRRGHDTLAAFAEEFFYPSRDRRIALIADVEERTGSADELPTDLITLMYRATRPDWDENLPLRESLFYMVASTQTTSHAVPHAVRHIVDWVDSHPEDAPRLGDLQFLRAAAYESLRLHTAAPALLREAVSRVELAGGAVIEPGELVALMFEDGNRDTEVFGPGADQFNPYRESPSGVKAWGLSFGAGVHTCIGRSLVTGFGADVSEPDRAVGVMARILERLFAHGLCIDTERPASFLSTAHTDAYETFPITLSPRRAVEIA
jgi:cytochrome P450